MSYDHKSRRTTPLGLELKKRIARDGPLPVSEAMTLCLHDPNHGYYASREAIGASGDFITAPEVSQVFGELIGLWCAVVWQQMGSPSAFNLIECGPGRGTMMRDMLRALEVVPDMLPATRVHLIETSPTLATMQRSILSGAPAPVSWWTSAEDLPAGPSILVANEFLDTFIGHQALKTERGWRWRGIGIDTDGQLQFLAMEDRPAPVVPAQFTGAPAGTIFEFGACRAVASELARFAIQGLAALFLDYGHTETAAGETLQALRRHQPEHPLCSPGEADLTVHVDFESFGVEVKAHDFAIDGPTTQAEFLGRLGIIERASRLMSANPAKAAEIEASIARLIAPNGMGTRFKAIGVRSPRLAPLPGFA